MGLPLPRSPPAVVRLRRRRGGSPARPPLPAAAKGPKRRRGCPAVASRLQRSHPRTPVYGGYPYILPQKFRRAKYGSGVLFLPGHRALMQCKISACSISPPRLVPTSRGRGRRVGDASIGTTPKTGNGRASVPPLRYEKKVLLQRNDGRGKPLPCGMGGKHSAAKDCGPFSCQSAKRRPIRASVRRSAHSAEII